jgi:hypothetical protein
MARNAACLAVLLTVCSGGASWAAAEPAATPQRPSLSFNVRTVRAGGFEMEAGAATTASSSSAPFFLKFGMRDRVELEAGFDAVRRVDTTEGSVTSVGDLALSVRARLADRAGDTGYGFVASLKLPAAREGAGTGRADVGAAAILSYLVGRSVFDVNLGMVALGREGGGALGQGQGIATLYLPALAGWSPFAEVALQKTAGQGNGGYFDAGVSYAASRRAVFDAAAGAGWKDGYPDWSFTFGWTVLLRARPGA